MKGKSSQKCNVSSLIYTQIIQENVIKQIVTFLSDNIDPYFSLCRISRHYINIFTKIIIERFNRSTRCIKSLCRIKSYDNEIRFRVAVFYVYLRKSIDLNITLSFLSKYRKLYSYNFSFQYFIQLQKCIIFRIKPKSIIFFCQILFKIAVV